MKILKLTFVLAALLVTSCTTSQIATTRMIADPIVSAVVSGYAATYGVPPPLTQGVVGIVQNQLWGMLAQAEAKQPVAQGASIPKVGAAVAQVTSASNTPAPLLITAALASLGAVK